MARRSQVGNVEAAVLLHQHPKTPGRVCAQTPDRRTSLWQQRQSRHVFVALPQRSLYSQRRVSVAESGNSVSSSSTAADGLVVASVWQKPAARRQANRPMPQRPLPQKREHRKVRRIIWRNFFCLCSFRAHVVWFLVLVFASSWCRPRSALVCPGGLRSRLRHGVARFHFIV